MALARYVAALAQVLDDAKQVLAEIRALLGNPGSRSSVSAGLHLHCQKFTQTMVGVVAVVPEMLRWLAPILEIQADAERLF
eukprot:9466547-Heterocapsa_arctica.AAC.1